MGSSRNIRAQSEMRGGQLNLFLSQNVSASTLMNFNVRPHEVWHGPRPKAAPQRVSSANALKTLRKHVLMNYRL